MSSSEVTRFGFNWGPLIVERMTHVPGRGYVVELRPEGERDNHRLVEFYISEKGKVVKIYAGDYVEFNRYGNG